jgi:hypothetical protein
MEDHAAAFAAHEEAHQLLLKRRPQTDELAMSLTSLATDLLRTFRFDDALAVVGQALELNALVPAARRVLLLLEADVHECQGGSVVALLRLEEAFNIQPAGSSFERVRHLELLKAVVAQRGVPKSVMRTMVATMQSRLQDLAARGCEGHPWQLPRACVRGLAARPWHRIDEYGPLLIQFAQDLRAATAELQQEFALLRSRRLLRREQECIHDTRRGARAAWERYELTATWRPLLTDGPLRGCSGQTPVACALVARLNASLPVVLRAGYSAVHAGAWLRPHYGTTNGQLKLHLGLRVPRRPGGDSCVQLRVANESRGWAEGELAFFDDSFEHEVTNDCDQERVVFQVVIEHPGLWAGQLGANPEQAEPPEELHDEL